MVAAGETRVRHDDLDRFLKRVFGALGMSPENAATCAADLVQTSLWGIDSHGILRVPIYAERLARKAVAANPRIETVAARDAYEVVDGGAGMGFLVGHQAMARAVELAAERGIGAVVVRNSNHYGAAALYVKQAVDLGLAALSMTTARPNLVVPGGSKPIAGNNPLAFGAPTRLGFPLLLDISMSVVAGGKLLMAAEKGERIPHGWATDRYGRPTDDPTVGFEGFLLPIGGHKGFGLSLMVDLLCGVLSGGAFQHGIASMYAEPDKPSGTCHMMIAIDPCVVLERDAFLDRMDSLYATVKASPMWDDAARMLIPGEAEHERMLERLEAGIPVPPRLRAKLDDLADRLRCERLEFVGDSVR